MNEDTSKSSVNDDELNQMIANLQGGQPTVPSTSTSVTPAPDPVAPTADPIVPVPVAPEPVAVPVTTPPADDTPSSPVPVATAVSPGLDNIKKDALSELRPLVDKLDLSAEEKFDTLLLIVRSTDDPSLLPQAHAAAKQITDETRRAQALLDVIKEIDYFGQNVK